MNKLITTDLGGFPFTLDRLRWLDDAYRDAWKGLFSAFGITLPTSFKLSGCAVTINGNDYSTTAGYICLNGECDNIFPFKTELSATPPEKQRFSTGYASCAAVKIEKTTCSSFDCKPAAISS